MSTVMSTAMSSTSTPTSPIPRLRRGVSLIVGMDNQPMLFDSDSGKYHRLGAAAAFIVNQFDGVRSLPTIIEELPQDIDEAGARRITGLVDNLREKSLLVGSEPAPAASAVPAAPARTRRVRGRHTAQPRQARHLKVEKPRRSGGWWLPRIIIARKYHRIVAPIVTLLQRLPARALSWVFLALAVCGYAAGAMALSSLAGGPRPGALVLIMAVAIQLVSILLHESWHAIVAGYLGTPIRGLGVALMFWAIPIAYVDRTDSYRVRSRRGLTMLALAGIFSDGVVCGLEAAVAWASSGTARQVALTLCAFQLTMLITNLNPLTQSDGVAAVEAATGSVNLRGRSMFVLRRVLSRQPLPPALAVMRPAVRWGYFVYGLLCSLLGLLAFGMSVVWIGYWLYALVKGFLL
ncbi:PqqD family protein [Actinomyces sp. oral taxon 170]|uniref:PqqD family protein n=1 Tax=Actinomyces sp. oral taxon 170 TaxID=712117 RepID=UPI000205CC07|nr:PqqD family protein [Actinomyces sp. oral taxon 170]EGF50201.1 conserved domain protein [Actinomyces sp. oral taxon 170 str. F0386]